MSEKKEKKVSVATIRRDFKKLFYKDNKFDSLVEFEDGTRELPVAYFDSLTRLAKIFSGEYDRIYFEQCDACERVFMPLRSDAKTCSINCRVRLSAQRRKDRAKQGDTDG